MIAAKANDAWPPHFGRLARKPRHHRRDCVRVSALAFVGYAVDKGGNVTIMRLRFIL
jgi:hypothetical protein